jgi:hypothetical protein
MTRPFMTNVYQLLVGLTCAESSVAINCQYIISNCLSCKLPKKLAEILYLIMAQSGMDMALS